MLVSVAQQSESATRIHYNSLFHRLEEQHSIQWQVHYFDVGIKAARECSMARSTVQQQKTVEWDILLQAIFLYLQDKVVEKPVLEYSLCNPSFG